MTKANTFLTYPHGTASHEAWVSFGFICVGFFCEHFSLELLSTKEIVPMKCSVGHIQCNWNVVSKKICLFVCLI